MLTISSITKTYRLVNPKKLRMWHGCIMLNFGVNRLRFLLCFLRPSRLYQIQPPSHLFRQFISRKFHWSISGWMLCDRPGHPPSTPFGTRPLLISTTMKIRGVHLPMSYRVLNLKSKTRAKSTLSPRLVRHCPITQNHKVSSNSKRNKS
jgi:hypothetical protein